MRLVLKAVKSAHLKAGCRHGVPGRGHSSAAGVAVGIQARTRSRKFCLQVRVGSRSSPSVEGLENQAKQ